MLAAFLGLLLTLAQTGSGVAPAPTDAQLRDCTSPAGGAAAARDSCEALLAREPANGAAQDGEIRTSERLALEARSAHDMNGALAALLRAQKLVPANARLLYDLGVLEDEMGLYTDADRSVVQLRQLAPDDPKSLYLAARVKLDLGQLSDAEQNMRTYLSAHPEDATAHYGLARMLQQGQQPAEAKAEFEKAVALQPTQTESYYQLGQLALDARAYQTVIDEDAHVLARNPQHGGALTATGIACFRLKQYPQAKQFLEQAVASAPDYQQAHYYYGLVLARLGEKDQSDRELKVAATLADAQNQKESQHLHLQP